MMLGFMTAAKILRVYGKVIAGALPIGSRANNFAFHEQPDTLKMAQKARNTAFWKLPYVKTHQTKQKHRAHPNEMKMLEGNFRDRVLKGLADDADHQDTLCTVSFNKA